MRDLLNTTHAWTISLSEEDSLKGYMLRYMGDNYASIKVLEQENNPGKYDIISFECHKYITDDDKRCFINHVVTILSLTKGKSGSLPFLYMQQSNDENLNFIKRLYFPLWN